MDWIPFLERYHIEYSERNASRGNISVNCPWCADDPSEHLGISLATGFYNCWRNENHRGRSPIRLIQALIKCSRIEAENIANSQTVLPLDNFESVIKSLSQEVLDTEIKLSKVRFPPNIKILVDKGMGRLFIDYLVSRDYTRDEARSLCEVYNLMYAITGPFAYRIIVPIEMDDGIATWTGRDITSSSELRYKTLLKEESKRSIKECLFGYKNLIEEDSADTLILCEGPFDCMRVDFYGYQFGIRATCLFGLQASDAQISLLTKIAKKFKHKYICLDAAAMTKALSIHLGFRLAFLDFGALTLPEGIKDPAELPIASLYQWFTEIQRRNNSYQNN